jgi:hypothetical protein
MNRAPTTSLATNKWCRTRHENWKADYGFSDSGQAPAFALLNNAHVRKAGADFARMSADRLVGKPKLGRVLFGFRNKIKVVTSNRCGSGKTLGLSKQSRMRTCRVPGCRLVSRRTAGASATDSVVTLWAAPKYTAPAPFLLSINPTIILSAGNV